MQKYATRGAGSDMRRNVPNRPARPQGREPAERNENLGTRQRRRVHNGRVKAKRPPVSSEEAPVFRDAVKDARPLNPRDRVALPPKPPSPVKVEVLPPEVKLSVEGDARCYAGRAPGVSLSQVAELRSGRIHVEATLD